MPLIASNEFQQLETTLNIAHSLNCSRLLCPIPVIRTQNKLKEMSDGEVLKVICTDPGTMADIPTWSRINGIEVLGYSEVDKYTIEFLLKK